MPVGILLALAISSEVAATITPNAGATAQIEFDSPVRAVTPGQSCVFYDGDLVLGGGVIRGKSRESRVEGRE